ncbi:MAG: RHS repeat-associated core domain-containing protein [Actinobacteria bacterium]|nr:RHS repeat-associated core domain-containing protein [Actinomycetota bacterium]
MSEKKTVEYINDLSSPISQVLQTINEKSKTDTFIYGLQRIAKVNDKAKADYYLYDALGSVTGLTNEKGALTAKYSYNEFGIPTASSKFGQGGERSNTYGYTGEDFDQTTGLLYLRARYYSPEIGRFISQDPLPGNLITPRTQNRYAYVLNNPLSYIDRLGLGPKGGTGATTFFNAWKIMLGEVSLEAWISGTVSGSKDIKILYGLWDITLETPLASYGIDKTGGFNITPNSNVSNSIFTNHWSVTTGNVPGDWIRSYYMTLTRTVSFRQGSLDIDYKANFTFSLGTPGKYAAGVALGGALAIITVTNPELIPIVGPALRKLVEGYAF